MEKLLKKMLVSRIDKGKEGGAHSEDPCWMCRRESGLGDERSEEPLLNASHCDSRDLGAT